MAELPAKFTEYTRQLMGEKRFERYLQSFEEEPPVSIRLNPKKAKGLEVINGEQVSWCRDGYYLKQRPNFTFDPLFHAGCYYVQEAASMFLDEILRQQIVNVLTCVRHLVVSPPYSAPHYKTTTYSTPMSPSATVPASCSRTSRSGAIRTITLPTYILATTERRK